MSTGIGCAGMALPAPAVAAGKAATSNIKIADIVQIFRFIFFILLILIVQGIDAAN
jgi:hypothetical protein